MSHYSPNTLPPTKDSDVEVSLQNMIGRTNPEIAGMHLRVDEKALINMETNIQSITGNMISATMRELAKVKNEDEHTKVGAWKAL
jgi:hypothetical protein